MDTQLMIVVGIIVLVLILVAVGIWAYAKKMTRSRRLKSKFGPEYDHTVARLRNRELAETELQERERRVQGFHIIPLSMQDDIRYPRGLDCNAGLFCG